MELTEPYAIERRILRKLVKDMLVREGRLLPQNEFNRKIGETAKKFGEEPEAVREVVTPILAEIFAEMVASPRPERGVSCEEMTALAMEKNSGPKSSFPGHAFAHEQ